MEHERNSQELIKSPACAGPGSTADRAFRRGGPAEAEEEIRSKLEDQIASGGITEKEVEQLTNDFMKVKTEDEAFDFRVKLGDIAEGDKSFRDDSIDGSSENDNAAEKYVKEHQADPVTQQLAGIVQSLRDAKQEVPAALKGFEKLPLGGQKNLLKALQKPNSMAGALTKALNEVPLRHASKSAKTDPETSRIRGLQRLQEALENRTSAHRAMWSKPISMWSPSLNGWVDFDYGRLGSIIDENFTTKGAMGVSHIVDKRSLAQGLNPAEVALVLREMVNTVAYGEQVKAHEKAVLLKSDKFKVVLSKSGGNSYVITLLSKIIRFQI